MADDSKSSGNPAVQSDEVRETMLQRSSAGALTAVGVEREHRLGDADERVPKGEDRGSKQEIEGGEPEPDFPQHPGPKARGLGLEAANFTTNGTVPGTFVGSPSGPIPVSAVATSVEDAQKRLQQVRKEEQDALLNSNSRQKLSRAKVESMSAADLRAVAHDRGYDIGEHAGSRATRRRFLAAQDQDDSLSTSDETGATSADTSKPE